MTSRPRKPPAAARNVAPKPKKAREPSKVATKAPSPARTSLDPRLSIIAKAFAREPRVSLGKLFASVGLRVDGKIFAMVVRGRLVLKLPKARVDALVAQRRGARFEPGPGRVMSEWIAMTADEPDALKLGREAFAFVSAG